MLAIVGLIIANLLRLMRELYPHGWGSLYMVEGAAYVLVWVSVMLIARPEADPLPLREPVDLRRAAAIAATAHLLTQLLYSGSVYWSLQLESVLRWCQSVAGVAAIILFYLYLRRLGRRVPDSFIIRQSSIVLALQVGANFMLRWLPGIIVPGRYNRAPGEILWWVATIYAVIFLWHARRRFSAAAIEAKENWLGAKSATC